jgi:hypothetical protein
LNRSRKRAAGAWLTACALGVAASYPFVTNELARQRSAAQVARLRADLAQRAGSAVVVDPWLSLRVARLDGLLSSWETVGGCGAGSSTGAGGGIKWIGRSATGGLFQLQSLGTYTHLRDGYNLALNTLVSRDLGEKWNLGFSVPLLYKYYRDYNDPRLGVDISNSGLGDVGALITRRFGEINNTSLTLQVGFPTGAYKASYKNDPLTQEKQLGAGKFSGGLTLDHTIDETWGVIVVGASGTWRGGQNSLGNYRAPAASVYGYSGYFAGPWVPSLGVGLTRFFGVDRDRGLDQLAILAGVSLPYGWESRGSVQGGENSNMPPGLQPWTVGLGFTVSPF